MKSWRIPHGIIRLLEALTSEYRQVAEVSIRIQPFYFYGGVL